MTGSLRVVSSAGFAIAFCCSVCETCFGRFLGGGGRGSEQEPVVVRRDPEERRSDASARAGRE